MRSCLTLAVTRRSLPALVFAAATPAIRLPAAVSFIHWVQAIRPIATLLIRCLALVSIPFQGAPNGGPVEIYGAPQDFPTSFVYRYSLEAEYQLPWRLVGTLGYQGSAGRHFVRSVNQNFTHDQLNPHFFATYFAVPDVDTNFNSMNARLLRRFANGFQIDAIYRWSKSIDTLSYEGPGFVTNQTYPGRQQHRARPVGF
jgi:hypothetical protein